MASRVRNLTVDIGADYSTNVVAYSNGSSVSVLNLTNHDQANSHVKQTYYHSNTAAAFTVTIPDATAGIVNLSMGRTVTTTLSPGNYVYDVMVRNQGTNKKIRVVEGILTALPGVSE